jgi:hypothetical protein
VKTKAFRCTGTCSKVSSNLDLTTILTESSGTLWHAERNGVSKRLTLTGWRRHVTWNAQNRLKLGRWRPWRSLVKAGTAEREREREAERLNLTGWRGHMTKFAEPSKTRPPLYVPATLKGTSTTNHFTFREREVWTICLFRDLNSFRCYPASVTSLKPRYH